jgi:selenocysteine-specific elongation factor
MRVVATAGHVDHGKSSLVQALTGVNPDRFEEEQRRGLTIDLGFAHLTLDEATTQIAFVDVPGHVRFLRNMLAGVGGVDACMFVVAATEGWKPQSEEHLRILELVGLRHGLVALTKADLVDDEWRELQIMDVRDRLAATFLADAPIVPVSSVTGGGLNELRTALTELVHTTPQAADRNRPRLWIDRVFAAKGSGTVVTGTLTGGALRVDDHLDVVPQRIEVRMRGIQVHGSSVGEVAPGHRVALNLGGVDHHQLQRGDALVQLRRWRPTAMLDASLQVLASLDHEVSRRGAYMVYVGSGEFPVRVRVLGSAAIAPGASGFVRLYLDRTLPLLPGDRFVLRESGRNETVGGGEVLDVAPVRRAAKATPSRSVDRVVAERGWIDMDELDALTGETIEATVGRWVMAPAAQEAMAEALRDQVASAGSTGFDVASLSDVQRAVLTSLDDVRVDSGRAFPVAAADPFAAHPLLAALLAGGVQPPEPTGVDRGELRELVRRGLVVERDGLYFHPQAIDHAAREVARLLQQHPDGFTVAQLRDVLGVSRKFALPIVNELDGRGVTRRRDDLRIGGPRLPAP